MIGGTTPLDHLGRARTVTEDITSRYYVQVEESDGTWSTITDAIQLGMVAKGEMTKLSVEHPGHVFRAIRIDTHTRTTIVEVS